jgi:hypothetical protein
VKRCRFPYTKYLVSPPKQAARYVYRPVIPVMLKHKGSEITFDALVDSGADECTFPGWVAKALGLDVYAGQERIFSGIGGSVLSYSHPMTLRVKDATLSTEVFFSHQWDDMPFGLLGQAGFFAHFDVKLSYRQKYVELVSR